jgi:hypothetical protein
MRSISGKTDSPGNGQLKGQIVARTCVLPTEAATSRITGVTHMVSGVYYPK